MNWVNSVKKSRHFCWLTELTWFWWLQTGETEFLNEFRSILPREAIVSRNRLISLNEIAFDLLDLFITGFLNGWLPGFSFVVFYSSNHLSLRLGCYELWWYRDSIVFCFEWIFLRVSFFFAVVRFLCSFFSDFNVARSDHRNEPLHFWCHFFLKEEKVFLLFFLLARIMDPLSLSLLRLHSSIWNEIKLVWPVSLELVPCFTA